MKDFKSYLKEAESATQKCGQGEYWCYTDKKCKKIPRGYHIGRSGYLAHDHKNGNGSNNGNGNGNGNNGGNGHSSGNGGNGGNGGGSSGNGGWFIILLKK